MVILPEITKIIGIMSGTSLDGLDIALCEFKKTSNSYAYTICEAETITYTKDFANKLINIHQGSAFEFNALNHQFGVFIGEAINCFLKKHKLTAHAIASHGHTIFHQPNLGFTTQIGSGASIAAITGITTICDFRSIDVALSGQGAPLVPIGDKYLFGNYDACLNLGGIANLSFDDTNLNRIAFDICVCNMALNFFANQKGLAYDTDGHLASSGKTHAPLLNELNNLLYYKTNGSKSLGFEWFNGVFLKLISKHTALSVEDILATLTEHVAEQIATTINASNLKTVFVTGGGAFNTHLIALIKHKTTATIIIPEIKIINFKEALIFAFLGYLRLSEQINILSSVTGATKNSIGGAVYFMNS